MTSIFPDNAAGGLVVYDAATEQPVIQPNVENASVPVGFQTTCDVTALPDSCRALVTGNQVNAIVSELLNFYFSLAPTREWNCDELNNIAEAFEEFAANLGGGGGTLVCSANEENAGEQGGASLLYCDGETVKRWTIQGEDGLVDFILKTVCDVPTEDIDTLSDDDLMLYCRNGVLQKGSALYLNLYTGEWLQARSYVPNNMVQKDGKLYSPNANIPAGTAFAVGAAGATWREVSQTIFPTYDPDIDYQKDTIVNYQAKFWAANEDIPAGTPFVVGTGGATWREIVFGDCYILDFSGKAYKKNAVVTRSPTDRRLFRAKQDIAAGAWNDAVWEQIGGERSLYRGTWSQTPEYELGDLVERDDRLYRAKSQIAAGAAWNPAAWEEVSPSIGIAYDITQQYGQDEIVSYGGKLYVANGTIPPGFIPPNALGTSGQTWREFGVQTLVREFDPNKTYMSGELLTKATVAYPNEPGIWRSLGNGPGAWDPLAYQLIGERNKFRGDWNLADRYRTGDIVLKQGITDPYGTLFQANSDIPPNTAWVIGASTNQWTKLASGGGGAGTSGTFRIYSPNSNYEAGEVVLTDWGMYIANGTIPAGTTFKDDTVSAAFSPKNSGRPQQLITDLIVVAQRNHRNATLGFTGVGVKRYILPASYFKSGDTISGYSMNGQLTIEGAGGVLLRTPEGGALRNKNYASFLIKCLRGDGDGAFEYLLAGDLQPIP